MDTAESKLTRVFSTSNISSNTVSKRNRIVFWKIQYNYYIHTLEKKRKKGTSSSCSGSWKFSSIRPLQFPTGSIVETVKSILRKREKKDLEQKQKRSITEPRHNFTFLSSISFLLFLFFFLFSASTNLSSSILESTHV